MASCSTTDLLASAKCFACLDDRQMAMVRLQLLCEIADAAASGGGGLAGNGSPEGAVTANPGQTYWDVAGQDFWVKDTGTGNTGWLELIDF